MTWIAVGSAAVTLVGGAVANNQKNKAAQGAANATAAGEQAKIDEIRRQFDTTQKNLTPYMEFGGQALPGLARLNNGDYSGFLDSPDYLAAVGQGTGNMDKSAASRGALFSGGHQRDLSQFNQGLAAQYLGNYRNSLFNQASMGQNAATGIGTFGAAAAGQVGSAYGNIGNAQANRYNTTGNNNADFYGNAFGTIGSLYGNYMGGGGR